MGMRKPSEIQSFIGSGAIERVEMVLDTADLSVDNLFKSNWNRKQRGTKSSAIERLKLLLGAESL